MTLVILAPLVGLALLLICLAADAAGASARQVARQRIRLGRRLADAVRIDDTPALPGARR